MTADTPTWMETDEVDIQLTEYDITSSANDFNVTTIANYLDKGAVVLPPYQRNYTWDKARASKLIESLILGLPVPQIFLYEESRNRFDILDGQQRLLSIYFFIKKRFPKKEKRAALREIFTDKGVFPQSVLADNDYFEDFNIHLPAVGGEDQSALHGLNYDTLGEYQRTFDLRPIRCVIIKQNEPRDDNSSVYEIFDRLNTGGVNLKPQEMRANLYFSPFYQALYDLNKLPGWRKMLGQAERDPNLRDVELLLRAFAMLTYSAEYRPSMTRFLNRFSAFAKRQFSASDIDLLRKIFDSFLIAAAKIDPQLFRLSGRFSVGVFEAAFYGLCTGAWKTKESKNVGAPTEVQMQKLNSEIGKKLQEGTTKTENVKDRLASALKILS